MKNFAACPRPSHADFHSFLPLIAALPMFFWLGEGAQNLGAQTFPARGDDTTPSMGVFRMIVAPAFTNLFAPAAGLNGYPGYHSADARLTSPVLVDPGTVIGRSDRHDRLLVGSVPVGNPVMDNIGYADYPFQPSLFAFAPSPTEEIITQIRQLALSTSNREQCPDPRVPAVPLNWLMVYGGFDYFGLSRKSIGLVQEDVLGGAVLGAGSPDFPARSFFDMFVEVNLPPVPSTASMAAFPPAGAVLYNPTSLVVTNLHLASLPPQVVYIHGETPAIQFKFRNNNPPYWFADDVCGYLVLAGHGTLSNSCASESALLDTTLGPIGTSRPELTVPWLFPTNVCPSPGTTYNSVKDVDIIRFTTPGGGTLQARNFVHGNLQNPINPPPLNALALYGSAATLVNFEVSLDGTAWFPAQGTGTLAVSIRHTSDTANTQFFDTEMLQLNISGDALFGPYMLRESPTLKSTGKHTITQDPQGFLIASFFDVFLEVSTDQGNTWIPADRALRVQVDQAPPCGVAGAKLHLTRSGSLGTITWSDPSYKLQTRVSLSPGTPWQDVGATSPVTFTLSDNAGFYRIICK